VHAQLAHVAERHRRAAVTVLRVHEAPQACQVARARKAS
jgi:hypothetical protein